ncbi:MAG: hypothetical protein ACE5NP_02280 [Anaerolineae bacterium]
MDKDFLDKTLEQHEAGRRAFFRDLKIIVLVLAYSALYLSYLS